MVQIRSGQGWNTNFRSATLSGSPKGEAKSSCPIHWAFCSMNRATTKDNLPLAREWQGCSLLFLFVIRNSSSVIDFRIYIDNPCSLYIFNFVCLRQTEAQADKSLTARRDDVKSVSPRNGSVGSELQPESE